MAMIMCMIMVVASMCMITSATVFSAEEEADTVTDEISESKAETEESSTTVETTVVTLETAEETTTTATETTTLEDVGAAIRIGLDVKVRDCVAFYNVTKVYDAEGNVFYVDVGRQISIVGIDDANQRFRVLAPDAIPQSDNVKYLLYADSGKGLDILSHEGPVVGDLDFDGCINAKDLTWMKRYMLYGWTRDIQKKLADMNADGEISISDLISLQKWLLGIK